MLRKRNLQNRQTAHKMYYMVMMTEYEKAIEFLNADCGCGCSSKVLFDSAT